MHYLFTHCIPSGRNLLAFVKLCYQLSCKTLIYFFPQTFRLFVKGAPSHSTVQLEKVWLFLVWGCLNPHCWFLWYLSLFVSGISQLTHTQGQSICTWKLTMERNETIQYLTLYCFLPSLCFSCFYSSPS